jgi:hypothetical protein
MEAYELSLKNGESPILAKIVPVELVAKDE